MYVPLSTEATTDGEFSLAGTLQNAMDLIQQNLDEGCADCLLGQRVKSSPWPPSGVIGRSGWHGTSCMGMSLQAPPVCQLHLHRAQELARTMPPYGELCHRCAQENELTAPQVDGQLILPHQHQPIPVCTDHVYELADLIGVQDIEIAPLAPLWPPWATNAPWFRRVINTWSEERSFYACYQAALSEDVDAMFQMGQNYEIGHGVAWSAAGAEAWYSRAAQMGYPGAKEAVVRGAALWSMEAEGRMVGRITSIHHLLSRSPLGEGSVPPVGRLPNVPRFCPTTAGQRSTNGNSIAEVYRP